MEKVSEMIIGIRHNAKFGILDDWGKIVDTILNNKEYFGEKYFPKINGNYANEKILFNDITDNYLKITGHDIIYRHAFENKFEDDFNDFLNRIKNIIIPLILEKYEVKDFVRIGVVFKFKISSMDKYNKMLESVSTIKNINDIRFSCKDTTASGRLFGNNNDYTNKLYTLAIDSEDLPICIYDYQYHFNPLRSTYLECKIESVIKEAKKNAIKDIGKLIGEENGKK